MTPVLDALLRFKEGIVSAKELMATFSSSISLLELQRDDTVHKRVRVLLKQPQNIALKIIHTDAYSSRCAWKHF